MTELNNKIIELIKNNASVNEICAVTGLSSKQLFYRLNMLKIKGYDFSKKYYYSGDIAYSLKKDIKSENEIILYTKSSDKVFKAMLISDLHFGNKHEKPNLLEHVYEYCKKNNINIIINGGDLIDGMLGNKNQKKILTYEEQIEYALKTYPYDKNILNFICLGNHDYDSMANTGQDIEKAILNKRHDIVPLGYGEGSLKVKNDEIIVKHPTTPSSTKILTEKTKYKLILYGHTHSAKYTLDKSNTNTSIFLPTLSGLKTAGNPNLPSIMCVNIDFKGGYFSNTLFEQFIFADKLYKVNEAYCNLIHGKNVDEPIKNEDNTELVKVLSK